MLTPELEAVLERAILVQKTRLNQQGRTDPRFSDLVKLQNRFPTSQEPVIRALEACSRTEASELQPEDLELAHTALLLAKGSPVKDTRIARATDQLLRRLTDPRFRHQRGTVVTVRHLCLSLLTEHDLTTAESRASAGLAVDELGAQFRRIQGRYRSVLKQVDDPWLWLPAYQATARIQRWRLSTAQTHEAVRRSRESERALARVIENAEEAVPGHPVLFLLQHLFDRYFWRFPESLVSLQKLRSMPLSESRSVQVENHEYGLLRNALLIPPEVQGWTPSPEERVVLCARMELVIEDLSARDGRDWRRRLFAVERRLLTEGDNPEPWLELEAAVRGILGSPERYWDAVVQIGQMLGTEQPDENLQTFGDLTNVPMLDAMGRLFRLGVGTVSLPDDLRRRLGEYAVATTTDIVTWSRSFSHTNFIWKWHQAVAIAYTLHVSPKPEIFGSTVSTAVDRKGRPIPWPELLRRCMQAVTDSGRGAFGENARQSSATLVGPLQERGWM